MLLLFRWRRAAQGGGTIVSAAIRRVVRAGVQTRTVTVLDSQGEAAEGIVVIPIVEGTTAKMRLQLTDDGSSANGSGMNAPELILKDRDGRNASVSSVTAWVTAASGILDVTVGSLGLSAQRGPYTAPFKLTDSNGLIAYYPNGEKPDEWRVVEP
jgi:hypothetical protein